jgi:hypothetical protein
MIIYGKPTENLSDIKFAIDFVWNLGWTTYSLMELFVVQHPVFIAVITDGKRIRRIGYNRETGKWKVLPDIA